MMALLCPQLWALFSSTAAEILIGWLLQGVRMSPWNIMAGTGRQDPHSSILPGGGHPVSTWAWLALASGSLQGLCTEWAQTKTGLQVCLAWWDTWPGKAELWAAGDWLCHGISGTGGVRHGHYSKRLLRRWRNWSISYEERLGLERRKLQEDLFNLYKHLKRRCKQDTGPSLVMHSDSSRGTNWNIKGPLWTSENIFTLCGGIWTLEKVFQRDHGSLT